MKSAGWPLSILVLAWCLVIPDAWLLADPSTVAPSTQVIGEISITPFDAPANSGVGSDWQSLEVRSRGGPRFAFRLHLPLAANPAKPRGMLVFLDGSGSAGYDNVQQMRHPELNRLFEGPAAIPVVVLLPQIPDIAAWDSLIWSGGAKPLRSDPQPAAHLQLLMALIHQVGAENGVDPTRIVIAGHSLGAFGALDAVIHYPGQFAACIAMAGGSDPEALSRSIGRTQIRLFHGRRDNNVPFEFSTRLVDGLPGKDIKLIEFPEAGHGIVELVTRHPVFRELLHRLSANN